MKYVRMPIEKEAPEQLGYDTIKYNLSESSVADRSVQDVIGDPANILLCYGDHYGDRDLRAAIATMGAGLSSEDILVTAGASMALFIIATSLLSEGDHLVVVRPNYATNIETPKAIGCDVTYLDLTFEQGFRLDLGELEASIRPETKYVSITYPHNPTGVVLSGDELQAIIAIVEKAGCKLLCDETYREMTQGEMLPVAATVSSNAISVSSMSKTYGIPGIRIGWLITRDPELMELFLSAKEQISITGSTIDEYIAACQLQDRQAWVGTNNERLKEAFDVVAAWVEGEEYVEWVQPGGGCVCFPRIKPEVDIDLPKFYEVLMEKYSTYVGAGHWFEMSDRHFRVGYGWTNLEVLKTGLENISKAISDSVRS